MANEQSSMDRRSILKAGILAAGAALLPSSATAATSAATTRAQAMDALSRAYQRDLERFAAEVEPAFRSGEVHGCRDCEDMDEGGATWKLERAALRHFDLSEDSTAAEVSSIIAVSPSADAAGWDWNHPCYHAMTAIVFDVVCIARERGWYAAPADEEPTAADLA